MTTPIYEYVFMYYDVDLEVKENIQKPLQNGFIQCRMIGVDLNPRAI